MLAGAIFAAGATFAVLNLVPAAATAGSDGVAWTALQDSRSGSGAQAVQFQPPGQAATAQTLAPDERNNVDIYRDSNEAVVNITTVTLEYNWFLDPVPRSGSGSGSILDSDGHVLTNYHVIRDAQRLIVTLHDGSEFPGEIVGADPENDLAVLKFEPSGRELSTVTLGSSEALQIGQKVLAIGNPFGLQRTLTTGVVSGLERPVEADDGRIIQSMIQTDASINPGNSGGPLLNSRGAMIGINTVIFSPSGGSVGIGFAVPVDTARRVVPELLQFGRVRRGWIDVIPVQLTATLVRELRLPVDAGLLVSEVASNSPAATAGLVGGTQRVRWGSSFFNIGGDVIVAVDGVPISSYADLFTALEDNRPGEVVTVAVVRGRRRLELPVELSERTSVRR